MPDVGRKEPPSQALQLTGGGWRGTVTSVSSHANFEMTVKVDGNTFSGTITGTNQSGEVEGELNNSLYTGMVTLRNASYEISGMWSASSMTMHWEGADNIGSRWASGTASKVQPAQ